MVRCRSLSFSRSSSRESFRLTVNFGMPSSAAAAVKLPELHHAGEDEDLVQIHLVQIHRDPWMMSVADGVGMRTIIDNLRPYALGLISGRMSPPSESSPGAAPITGMPLIPVLLRTAALGALIATLPGCPDVDYDLPGPRRLIRRAPGQGVGAHARTRKGSSGHARMRSTRRVLRPPPRRRHEPAESHPRRGLRGALRAVTQLGVTGRNARCSCEPKKTPWRASPIPSSGSRGRATSPIA